MVEREKGYREERIRFSGSGLELEGVLHLPPGEEACPGVVVCHPHPLYGGDMWSSVVMVICQALAGASIVGFRFNFRGVGQSQGSFCDGIGEREDVTAALKMLSLSGRVDPGRIGLAGYSFGAVVAAAVAFEEQRVRALALVSPPLSVPGWEQLVSYARPKLVLSGSEDNFVSTDWLQRLSLMGQGEVVLGADHFWGGYEDSLAARVASFFAFSLR